MNLSYFQLLKCVTKLKQRRLHIARSVGELNYLKSGTKNKHKILNTFGSVEVYNFNNVFRKIVCRYSQPYYQLYSQIRTNCVASENCERHGYHKELEDAMNQQISAEFKAMFVYLSMGCYFGRTDVALPGCYDFFMIMHEEEHGHAIKFINYQNLRGGKVVLENFEIDRCKEWSLQSAFAGAVELEKKVTEQLLCLNDLAAKHNDVSVMDLVASHHIPDQERSICEMSRLLLRLNKMGDSGVAEYLFDKQLHSFVKKTNKSDSPNSPGDTTAGKSIYI